MTLPPDSLAILAEGLASARRRLPTRAAVDRRHDRLARRHLPWLLAHSRWTDQRFTRAGLRAAQWRDLPVVEKPDLMANFDLNNTVGVRLDDVLDLARRAEATRDFTTPLVTPRGEVTVGLSTGTSGAQGAFVVSRRDRLHWAGTILASLFRPFPWLLRRPQRVAFFLRADGGLYRSAESRRVRITFFDLLRPVSELAETLSTTAPTLIVGPPSVLRAVARAGGTARPALVVSVAEVLEEATAYFLREHFAAPVVQIYQATEGLLGLPCRDGELHLAEEHVHVEPEPLEHGLSRPVISDLRRRAQPFLRYRLNDLLELGDECSCGSATRRIARIVGREDDALRLPGARCTVTVWPDFVRSALSGIPGLQEYRVVQAAPNTVRIEIEPWRPALGHRVRAGMADELRRHEVDLTRVTLTVDSWKPSAPGTKLRRVIRETTQE